MKKKKKSTCRRFLNTILCAVLILTAICFAAGKVPVESFLNALKEGEFIEAMAQQAQEFSAADFFPDSPTEPGQIGGRNSGLINILLIGQDKRPGEGGNRSDSMILCTFNPGAKTLTMTSVMRDLYVSIPGHGEDRINAAYALGGAKLLDETLLQNFGIYVDGNVEVDFQQFSEIIDLLGGVTLELRGDEAKEINRLVENSSLREGTQTLNGEQALHYARIRRLDADSDFSRTNRQRKVLTALGEKYHDLDGKTILMLVRKVLPYLQTDMSYLTMANYGRKVMPMIKDMQTISQRIPAEGDYEDRNIRGMAVLVANVERTREMLQRTLLGSSLQ